MGTLRRAAGERAIVEFGTGWLVEIGMRFEYDKNKSAANRLKHGIDFDEAQALWDDTDRVEIPARETDEPRYLIIGKIGNKYWSAVIAYRSKNIRLISVRRSRKEEVAIYESLGI